MVRYYDWQIFSSSAYASRVVLGVRAYVISGSGGHAASVTQADGTEQRLRTGRGALVWSTFAGARKAAERAMRAEVAYESIRLEVRLREALAWLR